MSKMKELSQILEEMIICGKTLVKTANALKEVLSETSKETPVPIKEETAPAAEPAVDEKKYSFIDVRKAFSAKSHAGFTEQVKALITKYGAAKLSDIKESDYAAIMAELEEIA